MQSSIRADEEKKEDKVATAVLTNYMSLTQSPPLTIKDEMQEMFLRWGFGQMVAQKLAEDQEIDSPHTLAAISDKDITAICEEIRKPGGLVNRRTLDMGNQISFLVTKNLKLATFLFKMMEHCSKLYNIF